MNKVGPQNFAVAIGIEDLAGLFDRESGLVLDPHATLWISLQLGPKLADKRILVVALSLDL